MHLWKRREQNAVADLINLNDALDLHLFAQTLLVVSFVFVFPESS